VSKPHIVQCLCGPARHCIIAFPYEPGVTTLQSGQVITGDVAPRLLRTKVDLLIAAKDINPWCGICHAKREQWVFEDAPLAFDSLEEAWPYLKQAAEQQAQTRRMFKEGKN
jgi:hypothetical protein